MFNIQKKCNWKIWHNLGEMNLKTYCHPLRQWCVIEYWDIYWFTHQSILLGYSLLDTFFLLNFTQTSLSVCNITSITSPAASALLVKWNKYTGATNYFLDLRVINATDIAPVVITLPATSTEKLVQGLRPGTLYSVTVKVFQFYYVMCLKTQVAKTGKYHSPPESKVVINMNFNQ